MSYNGASSVNESSTISSVSFETTEFEDGVAILANITFGINNTVSKNNYWMTKNKKTLKIGALKKYIINNEGQTIIYDEGKASCENTTVLNPCNPISGNKLQNFVDIENNKLPFVRYYNSQNLNKKSNLSDGWSHTYSEYIEEGFLYKKDGSAVDLENMVDNSNFNKLNYVFKNNKEMLFFNRDTGLIEKIINKETAIFIKRDSFNRIIKITNNFGEFILLKYNENNKISEILNNANEISLNYVDNNLNKVSLNQNVEEFYLYEDANFNSLLTSYIDRNGVKYGNWNYNSIGKVIESYHPEGYDQGEISYSGNKSIVTYNNGMKKEFRGGVSSSYFPNKSIPYNVKNLINGSEERSIFKYNGGFHTFAIYKENGLYLERVNYNYNNQTKKIRILKNVDESSFIYYQTTKGEVIKEIDFTHIRTKNPESDRKLINTINDGEILTTNSYDEYDRIIGIEKKDIVTNQIKKMNVRYKDIIVEIPNRDINLFDIEFNEDGNVKTLHKTNQYTGNTLTSESYCPENVGQPVYEAYEGGEDIESIMTCDVIDNSEDFIIKEALNYPIVIDGFRDDVNDFTYIDYDNIGNIVAIKEANCHTVSSIDDYYEGMSENPECQKTVFGSFTSERKPQYVSINGKVINITYDSRGNITSKTETKNGVSSVTTYEWDNIDQLTKVTYPDGSWVSYEINGARYVEAINKSKGERVEFTLNKMGQAEIVTIKNNKGVIVSTTTYEWGLNEKVKSVTTGEGFKTTYEYDVMDKLIKYTDHLGNVYTLERDVLGDIVKEIDPLNGVISKEFQDKKLASVTDQNGNKTTFDMDAFGVVNTMTSPDSGVTTYDNYGNGLVKNIVKGNNKANVSYDKDETNRLTKIKNHIGGYNLELKRDELGRVIEIKPDNEVNHGVSMNMTYDDFNNVTQLTETIDTVLFTTNNTFNKNGRKIKTITPSGATIDYILDTNGQIKDIDYSKNGFSTNVISNVDYYYGSLVSSYSMSNGVNASFDYNADLAISNLSYQGTQTYFNESYTFEKSNQISNITDNLNNSNSQSFTYDEKSQLTNAVGAYGTISYTIDQVGNRTEKVEEGVSELYVIDGSSNKVLSSSDRVFEYDELGNIIKDNKTEIIYDSMNRPSSVNVDGLSSHYVYNALNQRVKVNNNHYVYNEHKQLVYLEEGNKTIEFIYLNGFKVAMIIDNGISINIYYAHNNYQGVPRQFSDAKQLIVWSGQFKPYGEVYDENADISNIIRFTGQYKDMNTNYIYNYFRDYDSSLGRYIQSDPIGLNGGINTYAYVTNNPVNYVDPFGLAKVVIFGDENTPTHASILLEDGTYISTFPNINGGIGVIFGGSVAGHDKYNELEIQNALNGSSALYQINGLEEDKIKDWWSKHMNDNYAVITNNCSDVVYDSLNAGDFNSPWLFRGIISTPQFLDMRLNSISSKRKDVIKIK